jgi:AraC-like DNA-binding protein
MTNIRIGTFVRECQIFAGRVISVRAATTHRTLVHEFVSKLPVPDHPLENLILDGLLFNTAVRWSSRVHEQFHGNGTANCGFDPDAGLVRSWRNRHSTPIRAFAEWATSFLDNVEQAHQPSATLRVKEIIDGRSEARLNVSSLAREVGYHPVRLRAIFKREFGMSMREYQTRSRILRAAHLLAASDVKVDAVARAAGFPNRKNFYGAFKRTLHTNPSAIRSWSEADVDSFKDRLFPQSGSESRWP